MNKHLAALPLVATTLTLSIASAPVFAEKHVKPEEMTCEEFLVLDEEVQPAVIYWLHGKSGEIEAIDVDEYQIPVDYVVTECHKEKKVTVWEKVKNYFHKHTKPADTKKMEQN